VGFGMPVKTPPPQQGGGGGIMGMMSGMQGGQQPAATLPQVSARTPRGICLYVL